MQCGDFIGPPHWLFGADILHGPMQIYCNGCRRYLKRATQYYCYGYWDLFYSRKSRQKLRAIFREIREREIITLVFSSDAARNVPTLSLLTTRNSLLKMFFCRKTLTTHRSLLTAHCQTFLLLSTNQTLVSKWTKTTKNSSKTNLKSHLILPYCEILIFQLGKNNFPVEK